MSVNKRLLIRKMDLLHAIYMFFEKQADKDKKLLKGARLDGKAKELLNIIAASPFKEPPLYEKLVGNLSGFYSRRINIQHRLVYEVYVQETYEDDVAYKGIVKVARMWISYDGIR